MRLKDIPPKVSLVVKFFKKSPEYLFVSQFVRSLDSWLVESIVCRSEGCLQIERRFVWLADFSVLAVYSGY